MTTRKAGSGSDPGLGMIDLLSQRQPETVGGLGRPCPQGAHPSEGMGSLLSVHRGANLPQCSPWAHERGVLGPLMGGEEGAWTHGRLAHSALTSGGLCAVTGLKCCGVEKIQQLGSEAPRSQQPAFDAISGPRLRCQLLQWREAWLSCRSTWPWFCLCPRLLWLLHP